MSNQTKITGNSSLRTAVQNEGSMLDTPADRAGLTLALVQIAGTMQDVTQNLAEISIHAKHAKAAGADFVLFPECIVQGYNLGNALLGAAITENSPPIQKLQSIALAEGIAIGAGFIELEGSAVFNSMIVVNETGTVIAKYRKIHMDPQADSLFTPGVFLTTFEYRGFKIGCAICFDIEFPELARLYALQQVDLIIVPTALMAPADIIARKLVPVRALENNLFVAYANRTGSEGALNYVGQSCIIAPSGEDLARASRDAEMLVTRLDLKQRNVSKQPYDYLRLWRPDIYAPLLPNTVNPIQKQFNP
jgi:5-aminopentanamidase